MTEHAPPLSPMTLTRTTLGTEVYEAIKARLMDHEISPGSKLNMDRLGRDLGVSPTPVREALARLEAEGLVTKVPLVGYTATAPLDRAAFESLFEVRMLLEPRAARLAAERTVPADARRLRRAMPGGPRSSRGGRYADYREFASQDAAYHGLLAALSGNLILAESIERLHSHVHLFRLHFQPGSEDVANREHRLILEAVEAGAGPEAEAAMSAHLEESRARLIGELAPPAPVD